MAVKISIDRSRVAARIKAGKMAMVSAVAEQALADCNYFAKRDQGTLIESSQTASDIENGLLVLTAGPGMRLLPPLTITKEEMDKGIAIMKKALS